MVILDTDLMSLLGWENSPAQAQLRDRIAALPRNQSATTVITFEEFTRGWLSVLARERSLKGQLEAYRRLNRQIRLFCAIEILDFDEPAATVWQRLRKEHRRIGTMDLKIASIALARDAILLTRNMRDFQPIPGLKAEDWTKPPKGLRS